MPFDSIGSEFRVNTFTNSLQRTFPEAPQSIAMDDTGDFVVTWTSLYQDGSGYGIYGQRYNAAGVAQGGEFQVNSTTSSDQRNSTVAMDDTGDFIVTWTSSEQDGSGYGVYGQRYNAAGVAQGGEFQVNSTTSNQQQFSTVAMDTDGDFIVTWTSSEQDGSGSGIYAQRYNAAGVAQGGEFQVNSTTSSDQRNSTVAMDDTGDFVVTWTSDFQDGGGSGIYGQRYNAAGIAQGGEFQVNSTTSSDQRNSTVAMDDTGDFVVTWTSFSQDGSNYGVYGQRYNAAGVAQGGEFQVNSTTSNQQLFSTVAMDDTGDFVVTWNSYFQDGSGSGIYAQRYNAAGVAQGGEFQVNSTTTNSQLFSTVAMDATGDFIVAWTSYQSGNSDVYAQRFGQVNQAPTRSGISDITVVEDSPNTVIDLFAAFADSDDSDAQLTYTISNNSNPGLFSATPIDPTGELTLNYAANANGTSNVTVRATDTGGLFVETTFDVNVTAVNDAPTLANAIVNQTATEGTALNFTFANNTFSDADGDTLTYAANLASGASLPAWLTFDPATRTFSGTPRQSDIGTINLKVTAIDPDGATSSDIFALEVTNTNDTPTLSNNSTLTLNERSTATISDTLLQVTDADTPAAEITYTVTDSPDFGTLKLDGVALAANSTFTQADINANKLTYANNPVETASDNFTFTVSDGAGGNISSTVFNIGVNAVNEVINGTVGNDPLNGLRGNDTLNGLAGNDLLNGGTGNDLLNGGSGNDTYIVDSTTDQISEATNAGMDSVQSSATLTLSANVEKLSLIGTSAINGTGNASSNILEGNNANNRLDGSSGNDTLLGNTGNDILVGGLGDDVLTGGSGADRLSGGTGTDSFVFKNKSEGRDVITDFRVVDDTLVVSKAGFAGGLTANAAITRSQFVLGSAAADSSDRFIYNKASGALFFDTDGTGASVQVQLAQLSTGLAMTNNDIFVIA